MEDSKKKPIMIGVIVVCLTVAGFITYTKHSSSGGGIDDLSDDEMTWVKCRNSECNAEYEMALKGYYKYMEENADPLARSAPGLPCEKCSKNSAFIAEKCGNPDCAIVFTKGSVPNDFADRCPECKRSETEEIRNKRKKEMTGG
jgi:hypothetical protein